MTASSAVAVTCTEAARSRGISLACVTGPPHLSESHYQGCRFRIPPSDAISLLTVSFPQYIVRTYVDCCAQPRTYV
eukprot:1901503-Pleurochrysis_carterae.AAC.1